jgi:hypothetical protein
MNRIRILSIVFALAILLTACAGDREESAGPADTEGASAETTLPPVEYDYPDGGYDGAAFKIMVLRTGYWGQDYDDLWVEAADGDVLNDAVYTRNMRTEERLSVAIACETSADTTAVIRKIVSAGDNACHITQDKLMLLMPLSISDHLVFFGDIPNINIGAPWYDQNAIGALSIAGKLAVIAGDIEVSDKMAIMALVFNKKIAEGLNIENPYGMVGSGSWTFDNFYNIITAATADIDGNGILDEKDRWGFIVEDFGGWMLLGSSGNKLAEKDENDKPYLTMDTERSLAALDKIMQIMYDGDGRTGHNYPAELFESMFMSDLALFSYIAFSSVIPFRGMESDFGILPMPKYDEAQKAYYSSTSPYVSRSICVPASNTEPEMTGAVIESMSRESADTVKTAYYDKLLDGKLTRDDESSEMLDLIFGNILYDIGSTFNWGDTWFMYNTFFAEKNTNFVSFYEGYRAKAQAALEETIKAFTGE